MEKIKLIYVLLTIFFICSCVAGRSKSEPSSVDGINGSSSDSHESLTGTNTFLDASIKSLKLEGRKIPDLSQLTMLHDLEELSIEFNSSITDISPLASLASLKELKLDLLDSLTDISPLKSLTSLEKLTITDCYNIESIEALSSLVNLKYLFITYAKSDFVELLPLTKLETLIIITEPHYVIDASYIGHLHTLKDLSIHNFSYPIAANIHQLKNLIDLEELSISYLGDVDLSWITSLQKLKEISLRYCTINDVSPLADLPNLVEVDLWATKVRDITPLLKSESIKVIASPILETESQEVFEQFWGRGIDLHPFRSDR